MDDKLLMIWFVVSFAFSEPDQTRPGYPFLGSWIGSHPHRFVRTVRCVVDRDAMERGDLFPGMISREIDVPYVKIDIPMTAVFLRSWGCRLFSRGVGWRGGAGIFRFPPKLTVSHFQMEVEDFFSHTSEVGVPTYLFQDFTRKGRGYLPISV